MSPTRNSPALGSRSEPSDPPARRSARRSLLIAIGATPWHEDLGELRSLLTSPDDGTLAMVVIGGRRLDRLGGHGRLVRGRDPRALRGVTGTSPARPRPAPAVRRPSSSRSPRCSSSSPRRSRPRSRPSRPTPHPWPRRPRLVAVAEQRPSSAEQRRRRRWSRTTQSQPTVEYTVKRGDSLWKIAQEQLGDGTRYVEIVALNEDVLHGRPDFIDPGSVLRLPATRRRHRRRSTPNREPRRRTSSSPATPCRRSPKTSSATRCATPRSSRRPATPSQPDGERLTDPDLIRPGWELTIPGEAVDDSPVVEPPLVEDPPATRAPGRDVPRRASIRPSHPATADRRRAERLARGGAGRRRRGRRGHLRELARPRPDRGGRSARRLGPARGARAPAHPAALPPPGLTIAPPPPELRAVEKTAHGHRRTAQPKSSTSSTGCSATSRRTRADLPSLDRRRGRPTVRSPCTLPSRPTCPSRGAARRSKWTADLDSPVGDEDELSPYPLLASVGQGDDGHLWLLDLEHLGVGQPHRRRRARPGARPPPRCRAGTQPVGGHRRGRHRSTSARSWQRSTRATAPPPSRRHRVPRPTRTRNSTGRSRPVMETPSPSVRCSSRVHGDDASFGDRRPGPRTQRSRSGFALITLLAPTEAGDVVVELTTDGRLRVPRLGLDLAAAGLTADRGGGLRGDRRPHPRREPSSRCPARRERPAGVPSPTTPVRWSTELTEHRPHGPAGAASLLPEATQRYEAVAATTAEDIEALAPVVPEQARRTVEESDPTLDADLAEWRDPESRAAEAAPARPGDRHAQRVTVVAQVVERKAYFTELLTFLALHPTGVTSRQVREAFGITQSRARTDLGFVRDWLGVNPRTGEQHLPPATTSPAHADRRNQRLPVERRPRRPRPVPPAPRPGSGSRRRRHGGPRRGPGARRGRAVQQPARAGLELAARRRAGPRDDGAPSCRRRPHRRHRRALRGDLARARFAAETACTAAPYDEVCRLDLAKVAEAEGHGELADQILDEHVFNRTDDHLPPIDLPERTAEVVKNHGWGRPKRPNDRLISPSRKPCAETFQDFPRAGSDLRKRAFQELARGTHGRARHGRNLVPPSAQRRGHEPHSTTAVPDIAVEPAAADRSCPKPRTSPPPR